jgi:tRNA1(Val) A37 N6-methylase TrmN6
MKAKASTVYPRPKRRPDPDAVRWGVFCSSHAREILDAKNLPENVRETLGTSSSALVKAGFRLISPETHPDLLRQDELMLWPVGEKDVFRPARADRSDAVRSQYEASVDQRRRQVSCMTSDSAKSQLGQFLTPCATARFLASLFDTPNGGSCRLLDPGSGIGSLADAFLNNASLRFDKVSVTACEIDTKLNDHLVKTLKPVEAEILQADFIEAAVNWLQIEPRRRFTHAILNPPYRKIGSSSPARKLLRQVGIETVNLYSAFVALSLKLLESGGQLVAIIPRSFCNGPYYKSFRKLILRESAITHIHLFGSRKSAFKEDKVLQENVVIKLVKGVRQGAVTISLSTGDSFSDYQEEIHSFDQIVKPADTECFIHIPTTTEQEQLDRLPGAVCSLRDVGVCVSTGPIVDFRVKNLLRQQPTSQTVPLIYPAHCTINRTVWPKANIRKPNALLADGPIQKALFPIGFYCVVKRFSAKEEKRRITASVINPEVFCDSSELAFENHLNIYHESRKGLPETLAYGLSVYLNTSFVDQFFRRFNGHTQVNATDLRQLRYPSRETLMQIGKWAMRNKILTPDEINRYVQEVLS